MMRSWCKGVKCAHVWCLDFPGHAMAQGFHVDLLFSFFELILVYLILVLFANMVVAVIRDTMFTVLPNQYKSLKMIEP